MWRQFIERRKKQSTKNDNNNCIERNVKTWVPSPRRTAKVARRTKTVGHGGNDFVAGRVFGFVVFVGDVANGRIKTGETSGRRPTASSVGQ